MTFPCLVCGDLPVVDQPSPQPSFGVTGGVPSAAPRPNSNGSFTSPGAPAAATTGSTVNGGAKKSGGATIRTLSKDVSDKIFQNLCRHLYVKTEPYWFIQNPGEQMPLCAFCSGHVLEIYTLQSKVDQFQAMIKRLVWKLERIVADTEIAGNWMATREEQENEEEMWNGIPCPPMAIRIARERHHKFRQQILQNFKSKVKLRQKLRAAGQQSDDMYEVEPTFSVSLTEPVFENTEKGNADGATSTSSSMTSQNHLPAKRPRLEDITAQHHQNMPGLIKAQLSQNSLSARSSPLQVASGVSRQSNPSFSSPTQMKIPSTISVSTVRPVVEIQNQDENSECVAEDSEMEDEHESPAYPDIQIVCTAGPADYFKEEQEYSNSGDGDDSALEQDGNYWGYADENSEDVEAMSIREGEDVAWLAPGLALRKSFVNQLLAENLKPSVFLRKLVFAVFGMKQVANSSGISGSNKPGSKPSLDRYKFEALREYTIETYGIRDNIAELEDLNRKIRTICCDARKALKRKILKTALASQSSSTKIEGFSTATHSPASNLSTAHVSQLHAPESNIPDLFQLANGGSFGNGDVTGIRASTTDGEDDEHQQLPMAASLTDSVEDNDD